MFRKAALKEFYPPKFKFSTSCTFLCTRPGTSKANFSVPSKNKEKQRRKLLKELAGLIYRTLPYCTKLPGTRTKGYKGRMNPVACGGGFSFS